MNRENINGEVDIEYLVTTVCIDRKRSQRGLGKKIVKKYNV